MKRRDCSLFTLFAFFSVLENEKSRSPLPATGGTAYVVGSRNVSFQDPQRPGNPSPSHVSSSARHKHKQRQQNAGLSFEQTQLQAIKSCRNGFSNKAKAVQERNVDLSRLYGEEEEVDLVAIWLEKTEPLSGGYWEQTQVGLCRHTMIGKPA